MKKLSTIILVAVLAVTVLLSLSACTGKAEITIAIASDEVGMSRSLVLVRDLGYIVLSDTESGKYTLENVTENSHNIKFEPVEASEIASKIVEHDYVIINSDDAISAGLDIKSDALAQESLFDDYASVLTVKKANENSNVTKALKAALESAQVEKYVRNTYDGALLSAVKDTTDGYNRRLDYSGLAGTQITVGAVSTVHKEIFGEVKNILEKKGITVVVTEYESLLQLSEAVNDGNVDAVLFQNRAQAELYNTQLQADFVGITDVYSGPLCIYGGKQATLAMLKEN